MITHTSDTPTAERRSSPKPRVSSGTMRIPPPSPSSDPKTPAAKPPTSIRSPASTARGLGAEVLGCVREQGHVAGALQGDRQLALVAGAGAGLAARLDLGPLREVAAEAVDLLVVDERGLVGAERADLAATSVAVEVVALA